ncbi:MAG: hypothetical protein LH618_04105 [Saprospiraceae bacterium]|nr:hypothetical protein [Saprospiraceae bacterium]
MTQLLLEIPHHKDLDLLLAFVERLDIRIVQKDIIPSTDSNALENGSQVPSAASHSIIKPLRKKLRIADLKKEQNYTGINQTKLDELIEKLDIQEPIELLLSQLKA